MATQKPKLSAGFSLVAPRLSMQDICERARNDPRGFAKTIQTAFDEGKFSWSDVRDLKATYLALRDVNVEVLADDLGGQRAITASAFPVLAAGLTVAGFNQAYDAVPTVGQDLVTEMEDNKRRTTLAAVHTLDTQTDRVDETQDFPEVGAGQEKYDILSKRNGRRLSITAETIEENDVANIVQRVNKLGEIAGEIVEKQTLRRVCDIDGSATSAAEPYVLHLNGSGRSLYTTTMTYLTRAHASGTRVTTNSLVDDTDLEAARVRLAGMKNERGERILIPMASCVLLVPDALQNVAWRILNSLNNPGVEEEKNPWGPQGIYRPRIVSSPKLDDLSTTAWYLGDFRKQFVRKWKLRLEYVTMGTETESFLRSRIAFQARIAWDCEIGAVDYVYVVQSIAATTAP